MIDITLLGTSALLPLPGRALTAAVLTCCGRSVLFDCGEGTQCAARSAQVSLMKTDVIALTHYHGDHVFGLPGLLQTMGSMGREDALLLTGPKGLEDAAAPLLKLAEWLPFPIVLQSLPEHGLRLHEIRPEWPDRAVLHAFPTRHRVPSQGYAFTLGRTGKFLPEKAEALGVPRSQWKYLQQGQTIQAGPFTVSSAQVMTPDRQGLKIVFSGDTSPCPSLEAAARNADLLICEATYGEDSQEPLAEKYGHMTFSQAGMTASRAGTRRLWLTHFSQRIEDPEQYLPLAQAAFPDACCGKDGMKMTLRFSE